MSEARLWGGCEHHAPGITPGDCETRDCHVDPLVYELVMGLAEAGVDVASSCQGGGPPHSHMHRLIRFGHGAPPEEAEAAMQSARALRMPVYALARVFAIEEVGGIWWWEMWFDLNLFWFRTTP